MVSLGPLDSCKTMSPREDTYGTMRAEKLTHSQDLGSGTWALWGTLLGHHLETCVSLIGPSRAAGATASARH